MDKWATFASVSGAAAASLTGLLFVAVSIRVHVIARSLELRNRAAQALSLFVTVLFIAIVLSIPRQADGPRGGELIALGVILGAALFLLERRARSAPATAGPETIGRMLDKIAPNTLTSALLLVSGLLTSIGMRAGLYVLVLPVICALSGGVVSAWLLLTKITD